MSGSGLSLWLSPPADSELVPYIATLAARLDTVVFAPHATLVSDEIVPARDTNALVALITRAVAEWRADHRELELVFEDVRQGSKFYQCILAAVVPSPALLALHAALLRAFSLPVPSPPTYFPHLSLVYADLTSEFKASVIADLQKAGEVISHSGPEGPRVAIVGERSFIPSEILVVHTGGPPPEWRVLARIPLTDLPNPNGATNGLVLLGTHGATCGDGEFCEL